MWVPSSKGWAHVCGRKGNLQSMSLVAKSGTVHHFLPSSENCHVYYLTYGHYLLTWRASNFSCSRYKYSFKQLSSSPRILPDPSARKGKEIQLFTLSFLFFRLEILPHRALLTLSVQKGPTCAWHGTSAEHSSHRERAHGTCCFAQLLDRGDNLHLTTFSSLQNIKTSLGKLPWTPTSSTVSSCGVAALSSESFWEPASALLRTSLLFLCLWASFLTCPSAFPLLRRLTGLVSHFLKVLPGRLGPGELWAPIMWGWSDVTEAGGLASLLETERESGKRTRRAF